MDSLLVSITVNWLSFVSDNFLLGCESISAAWATVVDGQPPIIDADDCGRKLGNVVVGLTGVFWSELKFESSSSKLSISSSELKGDVSWSDIGCPKFWLWSKYWQESSCPVPVNREYPPPANKGSAPPIADELVPVSVFPLGPWPSAEEDFLRSYCSW